jgi:hypothetical protein
VTEPEHPTHVEPDTPAAPTDGAPSQRHGDPLLAASRGATEGTEGSRHGRPDAEDQQDGRTVS